MVIGRILTLTRYPVKSLGGEALTQADVTPRGLDGDRAWGVYTADGGIGSGKTTRRFRRIDGLLELRSRLEAGQPMIELPDGTVLPAGESSTDERLSDLLGQPVNLRPETTIKHHDESPLHLVTTASLRELGRLVGETVDARRVRANIVLDVEGTGFPEDAWKGRQVTIGENVDRDGRTAPSGRAVRLELTVGMPRCVMVNAAQPGVSHDARMLRTLAQEHSLEFGLKAEVLQIGRIHIGDQVNLI